MFDSSIRAVESVASSNTQNVINCVNTHDVDEDKVTITHQGGHWNAWNESAASGVMCRDAYDTSTSSWNIVAYKYNKNSTLITGVEF